MASTKADNNRVAWTYTTDNGIDYRVSAKAVYVLDGTDGTKYGGSAAAATVNKLPKGFRMRKAKCVSAAGAVARIVCYENTATLYATPSTSVTRDLNGTDTAFVSGDGKHNTAEKPDRDTTTSAS